MACACRRRAGSYCPKWMPKAESCTSSASKMDSRPRTRSGGDELRAIKGWLAERATMKPQTDAFFLSERRAPLSRKTAWLAIRAYGRRAGLPVEAQPHMLRHACGFALADQGADTRLIQDFLGHRNIQHTVMYTATNPARFERLWR